jgi:hypothetical protein
MRSPSLAVAIHTVPEASIGSSTNSSTKRVAVSTSSSSYKGPSGSYWPSPPALSISSTTMTGFAYSPFRNVSNTLPGFAFFHCDEAPDNTQPAVSELIGTKP